MILLIIFVILNSGSITFGGSGISTVSCADNQLIAYSNDGFVCSLDNNVLIISSGEGIDLSHSYNNEWKLKTTYETDETIQSQNIFEYIISKITDSFK